MKRWIHSSTDIKAAFDLDRTKAKEAELRDLFRGNNDLTLKGVKAQSNGLITEYIISRKLNGKGIEMYTRKVSAEDPHRSFGGGTTLVTGFWDVAQYMLGMEDRGVIFEEV